MMVQLKVHSNTYHTSLLLEQQQQKYANTQQMLPFWNIQVMATFC